ncbi:MAG: hypothetical protein LBE04_01880 [Prevotellaceae bacterium]|jgi:hypothetical protein|nr:hypothetical protein [Prevotellaceae bacterium]
MANLVGIKKIFVAEASSSDATQMPAYGTSYSDLGDVYQETASLKDDDPTVTEHKSETSSKKIILSEQGSTNITLSLMDPNLELLASYFGGTISGSSGLRKWTRPRQLPSKNWAVRILAAEGLTVQCPCVKITPKFDITYSSKGIMLVPMTIQCQEQLTFDESDADPTVSL